MAIPRNFRESKKTTAWSFLSTLSMNGDPRLYRQTGILNLSPEGPLSFRVRLTRQRGVHTAASWAAANAFCIGSRNL